MSKGSKIAGIKFKDAARLSGLSEHMLNYLGRLEILTPSMRNGRGRSRLYSFTDVIFLRVIAEMFIRGIEVKRLKDSLASIRAEADTWVNVRTSPSRFLVTDGTEVFVRRKGQLESKTLNGQLAFAFVLDLRPAHEHVATEWTALEKQALGSHRR